MCPNKSKKMKYSKLFDPEEKMKILAKQPKVTIEEARAQVKRLKEQSIAKTKKQRPNK